MNIINRIKKEVKEHKAIMMAAKELNTLDDEKVTEVLKSNKKLKAFNRASGLLSWALVVDGIGNKRGLANTTIAVVGLTTITAIVNHHVITNI